MEEPTPTAGATTVPRADDGRRGRRNVRVIAWVVGAIVAVFVVVAALVALPPILANLNAETSDGETAYPLASAAGDAAVVVPEGWIVARSGDAAIVVRTPDGEMSASVEITAETPSDVIGQAEDAASPVRTEELASGLMVTHLDLADGTVLAAVGTGDGTVRVSASVAEATSPSEAAAYRPAIGELLEAIE